MRWRTASVDAEHCRRAGPDHGDRARDGRAPGLGAGRHGLAPAGSGDEPGADVRASHHGGHPAGRGGPGLGVRVAGRRAGAGDGLGPAVGCRASRAERRDAHGGGDQHAAGGPGTAADGCPAPGGGPGQWLRPGPAGARRSCRWTSWSGCGAIGSSTARPGRTRVAAPPASTATSSGWPIPPPTEAPDASATLADPQCGRVQIDAWRDLRARGAADAPFTIVRVQLERLPRRAKPPAPLWLAWIGGELPADLADLWRDYILRFTVEHGFRFLKQALGWTTVRPRDPHAADRWTWLLALALWQLWLARPLVADQRLPWERPLPAAQLTPGRVRRAFAGLFAPLGTPARPPKPRGKAPGRRPGHAPGPRSRHPVTRRRPKRAA